MGKASDSLYLATNNWGEKKRKVNPFENVYETSFVTY